MSHLIAGLYSSCPFPPFLFVPKDNHTRVCGSFFSKMEVVMFEVLPIEKEF